MPSDEHNRGCNQDHVISTTENHSMQGQVGQIGQAGCGMGIFIGPIGLEEVAKIIPQLPDLSPCALGKFPDPPQCPDPLSNRADLV